MKTVIRRIFLGFNRDREEISLTISIYLNILSMFMRSCLSRLVMIGIAFSVFYWLAFVVLSLSPSGLVGSRIWLLYADEYRIMAAYFALIIVFVGFGLYMLRIYQMGKFIERRFIDEDIFFSEDQVKDFEDIIRCELKNKN
jgi:hypothetical protein